MMDELQGLMLSIVFLAILVIGSIAIISVAAILLALLARFVKWLSRKVREEQ